jgi:hypothetical protein
MATKNRTPESVMEPPTEPVMLAVMDPAVAEDSMSTKPRLTPWWSHRLFWFCMACLVGSSAGGVMVGLIASHGKSGDTLAQDLTTINGTTINGTIINGTTINGTTIPPWDTAVPTLATDLGAAIPTLITTTAPLATATTAQSLTPPSASVSNSGDGTDNDNGKNTPTVSQNGDSAAQRREASSETRVPQLPATTTNLPDLTLEKLNIAGSDQDTVMVTAVVSTTTTLTTPDVATGTLAPDSPAVATGNLAPAAGGGGGPTFSIMTTVSDSMPDPRTETPPAISGDPGPFPLSLFTVYTHSNTGLTNEHNRSTSQQVSQTTLGIQTVDGMSKGMSSSHSGTVLTVVPQPLRRAAGALVFIAGAMALAF